MPHLSSCLLVYDCSTSDDAEALYEAMQTDQVDVDFGQVKRALEANNSKRMSVTCASVGSLWKQDYFAEGIACSGEVPPVRAIVGGRWCHWRSGGCDSSVLCVGHWERQINYPD